METTDVRQAALGAVDQSKSFVNRQVDERTTQLGEQVGTIASDLRTVANNLRDNPALGIAGGYVDQGAELVETAARYLRDADGDQLLSDLEGLARRQPWVCAAGALALGFAASRFLKTSSARRYQANADDGTSTYANGMGLAAYD